MPPKKQGKEPKGKPMTVKDMKKVLPAKIAIETSTIFLDPYGVPIVAYAN